MHQKIRDLRKLQKFYSGNSRDDVLRHSLIEMQIYEGLCESRLKRIFYNKKLETAKKNYYNLFTDEDGISKGLKIVYI